MNNQVKFEQGNQARLDVTRNELYAMEHAMALEELRYLKLVNKLTKAKRKYGLSEESEIDLQSVTENYHKYSQLVRKVREALDRYE
jgi:hypothetical protein